MADDFQPITAATRFEVGEIYRIRSDEDGPIVTAVCTGRNDSSITFTPIREGDSYSVIQSYGLGLARAFVNNEEEIQQ
ncbi:hypothetical protein SEA_BRUTONGASTER_64 [Gordonia phage BrutonGaster]|uniref:Uncharacterized protein n=1 Tax=Gordonia phage BrutonGaster TaxID=2530116 RepID=A0A482JHN6_9CAUD|nr:hypothetical protein HOV26_gp118 [Gordonia phage BrutonGaster]QBP33281.1 hypothetical protein SEA_BRUTONGASTER_64 [Gordonia phage BrutonGaster]